MKQVTLKEIASRAGVSTATVSLVLNKKSDTLRISEITRKKVQDVIDELNFRPNIRARDLRLQKSSGIGIIVPDLVNPFFSRLVNALELLLRAEGRVLFIGTSRDDVEKERQLIDELIYQGIGSLVICSCESQPPKLSIPVVFLDRPHESKEGCWISTDHRETTEKALKIFFNEETNARVMFFGADRDLSSSLQREEAFIGDLASRQPHEQVMVLLGERHAAESGADLYQQWKEALPSVEERQLRHLFFSSYALMEGFLMERCQRSEMDEPLPKPLICFDAPHQVNFFPYELIYVQQDHDAMAHEVVRWVLEPDQWVGIKWIPAVVGYHRPQVAELK